VKAVVATQHGVRHGVEAPHFASIIGFDVEVEVVCDGVESTGESDCG
jgi:hypothetical protein